MGKPRKRNSPGVIAFELVAQFLSAIPQMMRRFPSGSKISDAIGCYVIIMVVGFVATVIQLALSVLQTVAFLGIITIGSYAIFWTIGAGIVAPLADAARRRFGRHGIIPEARREILNADFPRHAYLRREDYLDNHLWLLIEYYLLEQSKNRHERALSSRGKHRSIEELVFYRQQLLANPNEYDAWRRAELLEVLEDITVVAGLELVRRALLQQYLREADGSTKRTRLSDVIESNVDRHVRLRDPWYLSRLAVHLLTFRAMFKTDYSEEADQRRRRTAQLAVRADPKLFRELVQRRFFTMMDALGPYPLPIALAAWLHDRAERMGGRKFLAAAREQLALESVKAHEEHRAAKQAKERQRLQEQVERQEEFFKETYTAEADQLRLQEFRKRYVRERSAGILFDEYAEETLEFAKEIEELAARTRGRKHRAKLLKHLRERRDVFEQFWNDHELGILETYGERARYRQKNEEVRQRVTKRVAAAFAQHQVERAALERNEYVPVHEEFGYVLALARKRVREKLPEADSETVELLLQRELDSLLSEEKTEDRYFSGSVTYALRQCEDFRQDLLPHAIAVLDDGLAPENDRDDLATMFVARDQGWRDQYWESTFPLILQQQHEWQKEIESLLRRKRVDLQSGDFAIFCDLIPAISSEIRQSALEKNREKEHNRNRP